MLVMFTSDSESKSKLFSPLYNIIARLIQTNVCFVSMFCKLKLIQNINAKLRLCNKNYNVYIQVCILLLRL